jgi:2-polyprenyl-3-methyl-5-hydroxy-6-metoxy-1,4-benzoquinol methylase
MADSAVVSSFDPRAYWERRLADDWTLRGVGFRRMGKRFNEWAYRRRGERFEALVEEFIPQRTALRVLDVGSGTGFYLDAWSRLGAKQVIGLDLTDAAVDNLRKNFPELEVYRGDISEGLNEIKPGSIDVVSAMDVMFHIVDHRRFAAALRNIAVLLRPGGMFIWSDLFLHGHEVVQEHITLRSLYRIETMLDVAGFNIRGRRPMFFYMNEPRDTSSRILWEAWRGAMWLAASSEVLGGSAGRLGYRLDGWLDGRRTESPSTESMVCVKRDT